MFSLMVIACSLLPYMIIVVNLMYKYVEDAIICFLIRKTPKVALLKT